MPTYPNAVVWRLIKDDFIESPATLHGKKSRALPICRQVDETFSLQEAVV